MKKWLIGLVFSSVVLTFLTGNCGAHTKGDPTMPPTAEEIAFVKSIQQAVQQGRRDWLVNHIYFPIDVVIGGKVQTIDGKSAFLGHYKAIINDTVRQAVLGQDVNDLFKTWRGIMLGRGEIWINAYKIPKEKDFTLYIVAINNETMAESEAREAAEDKIPPQAPKPPALPLSVVPSEDNQGVAVVLRPLKDRHIAGFARSFLKGREDISHQKEVPGKYPGITYAEVDLDGDGVPELFLQFDQDDWCGNDECRTFIFQNQWSAGKTARDIKPICEFYAHSAYGDATWIASALPEKEQGRHVLQMRYNFTNVGFVHWVKKLDKNSSFCKLDGGMPISFKAVREPEVLGFVTEYLRGLGTLGSDSVLQKMAREEVYYVDIDLNDDGALDRVLKLSLSKKCDKPGCQGTIFRRTNNGFERICSTGVFPDGGQIDPVSRFRVYAEKENGFHRINTGEDILHWKSQKGVDGNLCWTLKAP
jgi:hypothetical protein